MQDCNPTILSMDHNTTFKQSTDVDKLENYKLYQIMISSIMYLVTRTHLELILISCFQSQLFFKTDKHYMVVINFYVRYIKRIGNLTMIFSYTVKTFITRFSNLDYGNGSDTHNQYLVTYLNSILYLFLSIVKSKSLSQHH
jgi:hypothetical protein